MTRPPRDRFPNAYVGDLVPNGKGWTVVGPLYCPNWHSVEEPGWKQRCPPCECGRRHHVWTCHCGAAIHAPKLGPHCRIIYGPKAPYEACHPDKDDEVT
ncbi:hypothetical protein [Mycobacteroides chelonae]|uniref:hypothetical protein n=1 Tax=Mycobacteroides chelonae TaxID=1774 RepID=UPI00099311AD|nr:hypothetical protein [Mycobacteroides chelonae]